MRNICEKFECGLGGDAVNFFLSLALVVILFSGVEPFVHFW